MSRFVAIADTRPINFIGVIGPINSIELEFPKIHTLIMNGYQVYGLTGPGGQRTEKLDLYNYMEVPVQTEAEPVVEEVQVEPEVEVVAEPEVIEPVTEAVEEAAALVEAEPVVEEVKEEVAVEDAPVENTSKQSGNKSGRK